MTLPDRLVRPRTVATVETLAAIRCSLYTNGPHRVVYVAAVHADYDVGSVVVCDRPPALTFDTVVALAAEGLLDGVTLPADATAAVALAAEVLRVATGAVLAARSLRPAELIDWYAVAADLCPRSDN